MDNFYDFVKGGGKCAWSQDIAINSTVKIDA